MNTITKSILVAITFSVLPFATSNAQQEGALAIEEIIVTARKRAESLQEVPIAITAFTELTIERAGIERPADFISLMPNVTIVDTANVGDTQVSIRGIVSTRDAESTFAYVVDGILSTNPNSFNEELVDVRQIEVLRGRRVLCMVAMPLPVPSWLQPKNRVTNFPARSRWVAAATAFRKSHCD